MLTFIYSTVNAGKSANLLMRSHSCSQRDISYCTFVPEIASGRDGVNQISSRIGFKQEAISLKETDSPLEIMIDRMVKLYEKVEVIFIDEAQFLTKKQVMQYLQQAGASVGVGDWRQQKGGDKGEFEIVDLGDERETI